MFGRNKAGRNSDEEINKNSQLLDMMYIEGERLGK